jgi:hypothetical protein
VGQPVAEPIDRLVVAVKRAEIEKDRAVEQGLRLGFAQPALEALAPLLGAQTPLGISGHDVAAAALESAEVQRLVDRLGEGQKSLSNLLGAFRIRRDEEQAVVLIGREGLLQAALGAEGHPTPGHGGGGRTRLR